MKITIFTFITIIFSFTSLSANDQSINKSFRAHEAIYDLNIGKITNSSKIHNAIGQMHLTVKEVCDGWLVNQNTTLDITDKNGSQIKNLYRYSTWESKENDLFRFISKVIINDEEIINFEGKSSKKKNRAEVEYIKPYNKVIEIPIETLYPMQHFFTIFNKDLTDKFINSIVFTGEDDESLNSVTTFIRDNINNYKLIRSAYFSYNDIVSKPKNEIEILVNSEDGIVHKVIFDYFDYAIIGLLKEYNFIEKPDC